MHTYRCHLILSDLHNKLGQQDFIGREIKFFTLCEPASGPLMKSHSDLIEPADSIMENGVAANLGKESFFKQCL